ncbi:MAG: IS630 family transposase [Desulfobacteraceae bacterium]|nr:IS630 family transposase [Lentisphaerota bacterium]MCP4110904.1 IS630 family transposase [Desulfobacteraceae bacterium]
MPEKGFVRKTIIVLAGHGIGTAVISQFVGCSEFTVRRWIRRDAEEDSLKDRQRSGRPIIYTEEQNLKIVAFYCQTKPMRDCGRWSFRWAALHLKAYPECLRMAPSKSTIHRILKSNKLKPHLSRYFLHITDPEFFPKMEHLVALYTNPPKFLFFFDECPGIQVLKRLTPDLRTDETKVRLEEFHYIRNGTTDVFAFLNHADGKIYAECRRDHKTVTLVDVFRRHVSRYASTENLHYVMDNLSTHCGYKMCQVVAELSNVECPPEKQLDSKVKRVEWLKTERKRIVIHFTPCHGSWLNLVEIWFGIMGKKVLSESFCSPELFETAFVSFVEEWNCLFAHPFRWSYEGKGLHELAVRRFTKMLSDSAEQMEIPVITKGFELATNLLNNYFSEVSEECWERFFETVFSQWEIVSNIVHEEKGPIRKKKAEKALTNFIANVNENEHFPQCVSIAA